MLTNLFDLPKIADLALKDLYEPLFNKSILEKNHLKIIGDLQLI